MTKTKRGNGKRALLSFDLDDDIAAAFDAYVAEKSKTMPGITRAAWGRILLSEALAAHGLWKAPK